MNRLVILITEGKSEENALYSLMKSYFRPDKVLFHIFHGDLLIKRYKGNSPVGAIEDIVRYEMRRYGLFKEDIRTVVQIADTDGLFIPEENIVFSPESSHAVYTEESILTCNPDSIADRNRRRQKNIRRLISLTTLPLGIPYAVFYLSRNLEHALYGIETRVNDSRKTDLAYDFSDRFGYDWKAFLSYIEESGIMLGCDYKESWKLIQNNTESLKRHTNLQYLFTDMI